MKKYWLETYGCQMNFAESKSLDFNLKEHGWMKADRPEEADFVLLNTCSVRQTAENRIWGRLGYFKHLKENHNFALGITGCMAERLKTEIRSNVPEIDLIAGNFEKDKIVTYLEAFNGDSEKADFIEKHEYSFNKVHINETDFKALVPIMHGCNNFCTYCIVPYVRGREVSRSPDSILDELKKLEEKGIKEVTFLGQNVNSYNFETRVGKVVDFPTLLNIVLKEIKTIEWFRFISSHPKDVPDELIKLISKEERICSHIHLAVQNGSNKVLERMNRKYTREDFITLVDKMKNIIPDLSLTTDLLIGFPGETLEDVEDTKKLMKYVEFNDAFTYKYNPREGTKAFSFDEEIDNTEKQKRLSAIIDLQRTIGARLKQNRLGQVEKVLIEDVSKKDKTELLGRTARNEMVVFKGLESMIGSFAQVRLVELNGNTYRGTLEHVQ